MSTSTATRIYQRVRHLSEPLAQEVMDFIEYLEFKHNLRDLGIEHLKATQEPVMRAIWDNPEDELWNDA